MEEKASREHGKEAQERKREKSERLPVNMVIELRMSYHLLQELTN